ncbi:ABC-type polysaccharide/polyol phosphate export permease [Kribbella aluminosa]|uniref:ABC-type polysaccharide/polyol phosphate export permease n=1 Tax=Kribbella aluminosa TaxID=416017 RepID=A0ABS4UWK8_9ACTN|nr:ABC transporter permease [Kribbella aluminosa]MBP2356011.1 ABC-type polysaccharide/polyol phosphate export permease [Kribbella aluminosa]
MTTTLTTPTRFGPGRLLTAIGNETLKGLRHGWSERLQILIEMPLFVTFLLLLGFTTGKADTIVATGKLDWSLDPHRTTWLFLGIGVGFIYTYLHVQKMFWRLLAEIQTGTLEQTYLSPLPSWVHVVAGRVLAAVAETAVVVGVVYFVTRLATPLELHWNPAALVPALFLILGSAGLALIVAGVTLVWKRVQLLNDLVLLLVMFFAGTALPTDQLPGWSHPISNALFMTHSIAGLRTVMLDGNHLTWNGAGGLAWMPATAADWFVVGLAVFRLCERTALRRGSLAGT